MGVLFWFIQDRIPLNELVSKAHPTGIVIAILTGTAVAVCQALFYALRLHACLRIFGHRVGFACSGIATLLGGIFSYTPISFVSGDAARVWHLASCNISLTDATKSVITDRVMGFIGIMFMALATAPIMINVLSGSTLWFGYTTLIAVGITLIAGFFIAGYVIPPLSLQGKILAKVAEIASLSRHLTENLQPAMIILGLSIIANLANAIGVWLISATYGFNISFYVALIVSPTIFMVAMIPISFAGWGLREGAAVVALGLFGVAPSEALVVSVTMGVALALAYSPGMMLFLSVRRRRGILTSLKFRHTPLPAARKFPDGE